jgi:cob(I)alamin adenosyltransferase
VRKRDEPVRLTKIYTRGGDGGETSLGDGSRASKLDGRIAAYGAVDELNAHIGLILAGELPWKLRTPLARIQNELFDLGADLSVPWDGPDDKLRVTAEMILQLERDCDELNAPLPELKSFVLPGGSETAARIHVARTVTRRAELLSLQAYVNPLTRVYLNRLSDLLFIASRAANAAAQVKEPMWKPGGSRS